MSATEDMKPEFKRVVIGLKFGVGKDPGEWPYADCITSQAVQTITHTFQRRGQIRRLKVPAELCFFFVVRSIELAGQPLFEAPGISASELTSDLNREPPAIDWPPHETGTVLRLVVENIDAAAHPFRAMLEVEEP